jgi:hypothetical protein
VTGPKESSLRVGDEVELRLDEFSDFVATGKVRRDDQGCCLALGPWPLVTNGTSAMQPGWHLTVTKMAPRPFYVNHDRAEPVQGDVVRDADTPERRTYLFDGACWHSSDGARNLIRLKDDVSPMGRIHLPENLILLVDGDTGLPAAPMQDAEPVRTGPSLRHPIDLP